jgi:hypothetical protein
MQRAYQIACGDLLLEDLDPKTDKELYTWDETVANSKESYLIPGLKNFSKVLKGTVYGYRGEEELVASKAAMSLFPKYPRADQVKEPTELIRFLKAYVVKD